MRKAIAIFTSRVTRIVSSKYIYASLLALICSLVTFDGVSFANPYSTGTISNASGENAFSYTLSNYLGEDGTAIARNSSYEYAPSVVKLSENKLGMWFCGGGGTGSLGGDSIWYSESTNYGRSGSWTNPVEVIRPSNNNSYLDYAHTCDPSVVRDGGYYYITYTGAPDWRINNTNSNPNDNVNTLCPPANPVGCDNRIFIARTPISSPSSRTNYEKLINLGECASSSCFQWRTFWSPHLTEYPPVPIIRNEVGSVWRRLGTGVSGYTSPQTGEYGIGQPSMVNLGGKIRVWHTYSPTSSVRVWSQNIGNLSNGYLIQNNAQYSKKVSNSHNDLNYDVAYSSAISRLIVTIAREGSGSLNKPCVHTSQYQGHAVESMSKHIFSKNLGEQSTCILNASEHGHNSGFLRDQYGTLAAMRGKSGGTYYNWVYYGNNISQIHTNPGAVNINRTPFSIQ